MFILTEWHLYMNETQWQSLPAIFDEVYIGHLSKYWLDPASLRSPLRLLVCLPARHSLAWLLDVVITMLQSVRAEIITFPPAF